VDAVAAVFYNHIGRSDLSDAHLQSFAGAAAYCKPINFLKSGSDEFLVGRAGYLAGNLWLQENLSKSPVPLTVGLDWIEGLFRLLKFRLL